MTSPKVRKQIVKTEEHLLEKVKHSLLQMLHVHLRVIIAVYV